MYLAADIGNTNIKLGAFDDHGLLDHVLIEQYDPDKAFAFIDEHSFDKAIVSSVLHDEEFETRLKKKIPLLEFTPQTPTPLKIKYLSPQSLGKDRLAAAVAAHTLFEGEYFLVIDAGTCITYDLVAGNEFRGGSISPGMNMRFKALNDFTGKLPLVSGEGEANKPPALTGNDTRSSILSGVINGMRSEFRGTVEQYDAKYPGINVVLTGGDAYLFDMELKNPIFADAHLVLKGLHEILCWNEQEK